VEKEDLEHENEELASKLADLTTQAKKMLLNNESLEEEIQDQQVEYEDRIAELARYTAELESKLAEKNEGNNSALLQQKHDAALETTAKLQKDNITVGQHIEAENDESRKNIGDGTSEPQKKDDIVPEIKAKKEEISVLLHHSHDQNDAAADRIECLKSENSKLRNVIMENEANRSSTNMLAMEAHKVGAPDFTQQQELQKDKEYIAISQTAIYCNPGPSQSGLCDAAVPPGVVTTPSFASNQLDMTPITFYTPNESRPISASPLQLILQIENLTIENGKLAQRLGNAVADKECKKGLLCSVHNSAVS
jgi:hypothetical protein